MDYTQINLEEREVMLKTIGIESIDELFQSIPAELKFDRDLDLPPAASELDLQRELTILAESNIGGHTHACFMGGGAYDHFIPVLIDQLISRGEFLTGYTPYQAEASQGVLQAFFEFQTQIARLTGLDIANASMYDGATAVAEAAIMALNHTGKRRVLVASTIHPDSRAVLRSYLEELPVEIVELEAGASGTIETATIENAIDNDTACVIMQSPNFFGQIEDWTGAFEIAHTKKKTLAIAVFNPIACGLLKTPGECGADIAVGEGQTLGTPMQFGGPYLGLFAVKKSLMRKMPGRLISRAADADGRTAYCLALQTREQHIRREKATSNICTNQGLLALRATMFLNTLGPQGLGEMAEQSYHKAHYLAAEIAKIPGFSIRFGDGVSGGGFFNEFVVTCPKNTAEIMAFVHDAGHLIGPALNGPGISLAGHPKDLLIAVTEKRTREELDSLVETLEAIGVG